ncbi:TetR/AcrR family transcriptional regulator [Nocardioides xinjiangensis]|uniref:TetR/AcrR family transcriptional regulator n=1 Tax=Nocardioides xinjiangensis TaxID=2817376 RepID=UPI001B31369E|nr:MULTISPECIES: TetR/AcrR family transcriptional regulator [unclassified Nocardioides]
MSGRTYGGESATDRLTRRRRQLLDAGLELFGTAGYRATTVRQLCREAKVSDRYFYEQFDSTEDLLLAVYDECTGRLEEAALAALGEGDGEVRELAHRGLDAFLAVVESDPRLARVVWFEVLGISSRVESTYLARMQSFGHLMLGVLPQPRAAGIPDAARELLASATVGAVSHTVVTWTSAGFTPARAVVSDALARFLAGAASAISQPA